MTTTVGAPRRLRLAELPQMVGEVLGPSEPVLITQHHIDEFAEATFDHQWIHVDVERAATGPFGQTIAHGYLTMSLGPALIWSMIDVVDADQVINYGLDKVRFPSPLPSGSPVAMTATIVAVDPCPGGYQIALDGVFGIPGAPKPACVGRALFRFVSSGASASAGAS